MSPARMEFCLRTAYAHGTAAIRTHIDSIGPQTRISWPVVAEARERWRGRIDLQAAPLFMHRIRARRRPYGRDRGDARRLRIRHPRRRRPPWSPACGEGLDVLFALAERKGWDLDFHVDESADPAARSLRVIAETAIRRRFPGRILVGHCCSLSLQDEDEQRRTIEAVAKAGSASSLCRCATCSCRTGGSGRTPRWRGVTALHELKDAGVNVMIASDNVRDPFYAYGDLDMLEVWREGVRILHLDYPFADWASVVREAPAAGDGAGRRARFARAQAPT